MTYSDTHPESTDRVVRGTVVSLLIIPVGVAVWVAIWSGGIIASPVAYGIAFGAVWLYTKGSGGFVSRAGAWMIAAVVVVTLALSFWFGLVVDAAYGLGNLDRLNEPVFWAHFNEGFGERVSQNAMGLLLGVGLAALGVYSTLKRTFAHAKATSTRTALSTPPVEPYPTPEQPTTTQPTNIEPTTTDPRD